MAAGSAQLTPPFAPGSVSLRLYPHNDLDAPAIVEELRHQARLAVEHGFDGVMTAEHHGGFAGYLPNPVQTAGWLLEAMPAGWAAPCPVLLPLRPVALLAEEIAWLAARFPGRVGLGLAAGALADDFDLMGVSMDGLTARFATGLAEVTAALSGGATGVLAGDQAVRWAVRHPVPVLSAAMGLTAARRAAEAGVGLLFDSLSAPARVRQLTDEYRAAGGTRPCVLIRRAWLGAPPQSLVDRQLDVYRGYAGATAQSHWDGDQLVGDADGASIAGRLADTLVATGTDALNLRIHVPGVDPSTARDQIARLGEEMMPALRAALLACS
ncbi:MAG: LLM class flavin-dependent oxidoreductase [Acidimicrobiales bacterium]